MHYVVRNVFTARPGKAKELAAIFKRASPRLVEREGLRSQRILTDAVAGFWTVVVENEVEDLDAYFTFGRKLSADPEIGELLKGYTDFVDHGRREIFVVE